MEDLWEVTETGELSNKQNSVVCVYINNYIKLPNKRNYK